MNGGYLLLEAFMTYISQGDMNKKITEHGLWYRHGDGLHGELLAIESADISDLDLSFSLLSKAYFSGVVANNIALNNSILELCCFSGCDLSNSNLSNSDFSGANLYECNLSNSDLSNSLFDGAGIVGCNFLKTNIYNAKFSDTCFVPVLIRGPENNTKYCSYYFSECPFASLSGCYYVMSNQLGYTGFDLLNKISDQDLRTLLFKNIDIVVNYNGMVIIERDDFRRLILPYLHSRNSSI